MPLVGVSAFYSLECFDTDGWVARRTSCLQKPCSINPRGSLLEQSRSWSSSSSGSSWVNWTTWNNSRKRDQMINNWMRMCVCSSYTCIMHRDTCSASNSQAKTVMMSQFKTSLLTCRLVLCSTKKTEKLPTCQSRRRGNVIVCCLIVYTDDPLSSTHSNVLHTRVNTYSITCTPWTDNDDQCTY